MDNKITNIIFNSLYNNLVINDGDSSISYHKKDISPDISKKVTIDDLNNIFNNDPESIFWYDTSECLLLILDNEIEIPLNKYKIDMHPVFLKLTDNKLKKSGNEIIIALDKNHYCIKACEWSNNTVLLSGNRPLSISEAKRNFNGYKDCQRLLNACKELSDRKLGKYYTVPAIRYCEEVTSPISEYNGFLPAMGQIIYILAYLKMINYIFEQLNSTELILDGGCWWSSSEYSDKYAWILINGKVCSDNKSAPVNVLPIFKK